MADSKKATGKKTESRDKATSKKFGGKQAKPFGQGSKEEGPSADNSKKTAKGKK